jgi:hypothetical protein
LVAAKAKTVRNGFGSPADISLLVRTPPGTPLAGLACRLRLDIGSNSENAKVNRDQRPGRARRPHHNRKLTMLIPATSENVASRHCSDECELNSQKTACGGDGIAKF